MITIHFKNVGQGDSIILEWSNEGKNYLGLIDCNTINGLNPTLEHLKGKSNYIFEFIILSHFHLDHFSGMADIFQYCINNKIKVKYFYHTLASCLDVIYNRIFTSQRVGREIAHFIEMYELFDAQVEDKIYVHAHVADLNLTEKIILSFLAPSSRIYEEMSKQLSRKVNKITTTPADVNRLSTIVEIRNETQSILLTSDAVKKSFKKIRNKISSEVVLVQAPHHGSWKNIDEAFWINLRKRENCPAVFSVGDEPKDKLPNKETVAFFDDNYFDIHSTNSVYGINSHFGLTHLTEIAHRRSTVLNSFSKLREVRSTLVTSNKFNGDHKFTLL